MELGNGLLCMNHLCNSQEQREEPVLTELDNEIVQREIRRKQFNTIERVLTIVQYILLAILVLVNLQIILDAQYSTILLSIYR
jgi:hypothetical protein